MISGTEMIQGIQMILRIIQAGQLRIQFLSRSVGRVRGASHKRLECRRALSSNAYIDVSDAYWTTVFWKDRSETANLYLKYSRNTEMDHQQVELQSLEGTILHNTLLLQSSMKTS